MKPYPLNAISNITESLNGHYFITGTDTEIGKTTTTANLVKALAKHGKTVYGIKPVTAGLIIDAHGKAFSDDAKRINQFATIKPPINAIAPIQLTTPCSPHIAAKIDNIILNAKTISHTIHQTLQSYPADVVFIEGAGGWFTPINDSQTLADVAIELGLPVIVVVGVKLGSLNHAMLTLQAIWQAGLNVAMVVFNQINENTPFFGEQIDWLSQNIMREASHHQRQAPLLICQKYDKALI